MVRTGWFSVALVALSTAACSSLGRTEPKVATAQAAEEPTAELMPLEGQGASKVSRSGRRVGDYVAHRFSGAFRSEPLTLVEEVVAREDGLVAVDYTLERGDKSRTVRVRFKQGTDEVARVHLMEGDVELPGTVADYEALLAETTFAPDYNDKKLASESQTCLVGPKELDCEMTKYRVFVGDDEATLAVARSAELDRDLSGEVTAVDGTILYRAELVEVREGKVSSEASAKLEQ